MAFLCDGQKIAQVLSVVGEGPLLQDCRGRKSCSEVPGWIAVGGGREDYRCVGGHREIWRRRVHDPNPPCRWKAVGVQDRSAPNLLRARARSWTGPSPCLPEADTEGAAQ